MSVRVMAKVWELDLPQPLKLLALALADSGNDDGENIYPSKAYLAWKVGAHPKTIQRQLAELEARGIVEVVSHRGHKLKSGQWTKMLKLHPERGDKLLPLIRQDGTVADRRGSAGGRKGERSYVPQSVSDPLEIRDQFQLMTEHPKQPHESQAAYAIRLGRLRRTT